MDAGDMYPIDLRCATVGRLDWSNTHLGQELRLECLQARAVTLDGLQVDADLRIAGMAIGETAAKDQVLVSSDRETAGVPKVGDVKPDLSCDSIAIDTAIKGRGKIKIDGKVDLRGADVGGRVNLLKADVDEDIDLRNADVEERVILKNANVGWLVDFEDADVDEGINLRGTDVGGRVDLIDADVGGRVNLLKADVGGRVDLLRTDVNEWVTLKNANVGGRVSLWGADVGWFVDLEDADVGGRVTFIGADVGWFVDLEDADVGGRVDLRNADVGGDLLFQDATVRSEIKCLPQEVRGHVNFRGCVVEDDLIISIAKKTHPAANAIDMSNAVIAEGRLQQSSNRRGQESEAAEDRDSTIVAAFRQPNTEALQFSWPVWGRRNLSTDLGGHLRGIRHPFCRQGSSHRESGEGMVYDLYRSSLGDVDLRAANGSPYRFGRFLETHITDWFSAKHRHLRDRNWQLHRPREYGLHDIAVLQQFELFRAGKKKTLVPMPMLTREPKRLWTITVHRP